MNIVIIGTGEIEQSLVKLCSQSKHLSHIYTASNEALEDVPNIEYFDFEDLIEKIKAVQADIVLVADKNLIEKGIVDFCKRKLVNIIAVNEKWFHLESSRMISKKLLDYYSFNTPAVLKAPVSFPIVIKTDRPSIQKLAYSMDELVKIRTEIEGQIFFLEEYLEGEIMHLLSLWDGKSAIHFVPKRNFTEVQEYRLDAYKTKLNFMLSEEKADFVGFFTTKLIWAKNDWYILECFMRIAEKPDLYEINSDFLYILNSAIYQKLNEIKN